MGKPMLIICAGVLIALGYISMNTANQGKSMTQKTVNYAEYTMSKNAAHTAIQMAMQYINVDDTWADTHNKSNPWETTIQDIPVELYMDHVKSDDFWEPDSLRLYSTAISNSGKVEVVSLYLKQPFSSLVPTFEGAASFPGGFNSFNADGNAHSISGKAPKDSGCEDKAAITVRSQEMADKLPGNLNTEGEPPVAVDPDLSYEPTDELIERLWNSGNAISLTQEYSGSLGTADNPGVFFVDTETVRLTGGQSTGYGIMVIRSGGYMDYEGGLEIRGNFEFNGLVIFENAFDFDGRGTPTINGSVLVGNTEGYDETINVDLGGNIHLQYDCIAEKYAKMAAAKAVQQNKYSRIVTREGTTL